MSNDKLNFMFLVSIFIFAFHLFTKVETASLGGCSDDATCTDLCGYAGAGKCVNNSYCVCETCPQRSTAELSLAYAVKVCTPEPICQLSCPRSSLSKLYSGHICSTPKSLLSITCICFCMPLTLQSLGTVIRCPVIPNNTLSHPLSVVSGLMG